MRSFRAEWCEKYSWLHYDNSTDAAYCYICMKAELGNKFLASTKRDPAFISKGFKNWKDATIAFNAHLRSDCHKEGCEILELRSTTNDVAENLSKMYKEENELNRMMLIKTNASSERSFSSMRRLKTYLRNTMCQSRLNHVMLLNIHQEKLDALSMDDIAGEFIQGNDHKLRLFGRV